MSTAAAYEALRPVPPLGQQRQQFAFLLAARDAARRTLDLLLGAPRGAWTLLRRTTAGWLSRLLPTSAVAALRRLLAPMAWLRSATAVVGLLPLLGVALTTPPAQGLVSRALGFVGRLSVKTGGALWRAADAGLRFFGNRGSRLADRLAAAGRRIAGRAASLAADPRAGSW